MARPKSNRWAGADEAIGHACAQLLHWGLPRVEVFATVSGVAGRVFGRRIGAERVRQVYRTWALQARGLGYRNPSGITKESRSMRRPPEPIDALAERLLRDHRPGSLQQLARQRDALADAERVAGQIGLPVSAPGPDPLDDPKWIGCGGGTHPDDMSDAQRAAFEALTPHEREYYRVLVERDGRAFEAFTAHERGHYRKLVKGDGRAFETLTPHEHEHYRAQVERDRWGQYAPLVDAAFARLDEVFGERFYALPGTAVEGTPTPIRGRTRPKKIG